MKVTLEDNYKLLYTVSDLDNAKTLINEMKEDSSKPADYLEMAIREDGKKNGYCLVKVLDAKAETFRCSNIEYDFFGHGTGFIDVAIEGCAVVCFNNGEIGFVNGLANLSDIFKTGSEPYDTYFTVYKAAK